MNVSSSISHTMLSSALGFNPNCVDSLFSLAVFLPLQVRCIGQSEVKIDGWSKLARTLLTRFYDREM